MLHAVVMAGGKGKRFWPLSRAGTPKQLLNIVGRQTMLEQTVARLKLLVDESCIWVVANSRQAPAIQRLLPGLPVSHILREPVGRNTAPCIALAALVIGRKDPEAIMAVLPADHVISPGKEFRKTIRAASRQAARHNFLITIGIKPRYPATAYGYIKKGKKIVSSDSYSFYTVEKFIEKPDRARAKRFVRSQLYCWNSGMFVWSVGAICQAMEQHLPEIATKLQPFPYLPVKKRKEFLKKVYPSLPAISIDYGIMEKHKKVLVTFASFDWDDVGSWAALENHFPKDVDHNLGKGEWVTQKASDCIAFSTKPLIGLVGVSNLIVVATEDAVLVCSRENAQNVKKLVESLEKNAKYHPYL